MNETRLQTGAFEFSVGCSRILCDIEPELHELVPSFVNPRLADGRADGPRLTVIARRQHGTSPAERGLPLTCTFGPANGFTAPGRIELWDGSSLVVAELDGSSVSAQVGAESDPHFVGAVMLFTATALALRAHGLFHLHAACVDVPELGTVLIVGESGSGKTTLALGLAALGGSLVTDDAVFLSDAGQDNAEVWGWPADMHLGPPTLGAFPQLARQAYRAVTGSRDKLAVPLSALRPAWLPSALRPTLVLFPSIRPVTVSQVTALEPAETVVRLIQQSGLLVVSGAVKAQEHLELITEIASAGVGLELTLGTDALPAGPALIELLRGFVRHCAM